MTIVRHRSPGLRRLAACTAMQVLAMLVVVILPLNGARLAASSIVSPAHYHIAKEVPALALLVAEAPHHHPVQADHVELPDADIPEVPQHASGGHAGHHDHAREHRAHRAVFDPGHHQDPATDARDHDAWIGHHSHGLEQAGVVYVENEPERTELGAAGSQLTAGTEAALPARWMSILAMPGTQLLPEGIRRFVSRDSEPLLRPPSACGSSHA